MSWEMKTAMRALLCIKQRTTEDLCRAQGTLLSACGDVNRKEIQKRWDICTCIDDSLCFTAETDTTTLSSNYLPIKYF